jgi:hypothetical protein
MKRVNFGKRRPERSKKEKLKNKKNVKNLLKRGK